MKRIFKDVKTDDLKVILSALEVRQNTPHTYLRDKAQTDRLVKLADNEVRRRGDWY